MDSIICQACLSENRRIVPLLKIHSVIHEMNVFELQHLRGGVCWECQRVMEKFIKFKLQVKKAQHSLKLKEKNRICYSQLSVESKYLYDYHYNYNFDPLTNTNDSKTEVNPIKEEDFVTEYHDYDEEHTDSKTACDHKPDITNQDINIYVDTIKHQSNNETTYEEYSNSINCNNCFNDSNRTSCLLGPESEVRLTKINEEVTSIPFTAGVIKNKKQLVGKVKDKFKRINFSIEEMLKNREDKRNHPNFKKIPFKCDSCVLGFTRKETFDVHVAKKHEEVVGRYICDVCKIRFPNKKPLERHCQKHFTVYRCKFCKFESIELWSALNHCKAKHSADDVDNIHCQQCPLVVRTVEELNEHIKALHMVYCNECGEKFKGNNTLRTHKRRIHGVKREFICEFCTKSFATRTRLESHAAGHSTALAKQLAYCALCRVQYKSVHVYRSHLRHSAAHSKNQFACPDPQCDKKFSSKIYLTKHHNFYHLKKSQFKCEICNKLFISDWRLKNHRQKHHGLSRTRDHPCNVCGKKFYTQSTLRGHQLTHSEQRSYMCEDCGDTFKQRPALYTHSRLVHKGVKRKK